jgi:iron-sulfur cluster assembly protein
MTQSEATVPSEGLAARGEGAEVPIRITPKAIEMGRRKLEEASQDGEEGVLGIRVGIRGGGCNGYAYVFDFAKKVRPKRDRVLDFEGLTLVVDDRSIEYLQGSVLDWEEKLLGYGFKWRNPNATGSCGCGESFSV